MFQMIFEGILSEISSNNKSLHLVNNLLRILFPSLFFVTEVFTNRFHYIENKIVETILEILLQNKFFSPFIPLFSRLVAMLRILYWN